MTTATPTRTVDTDRCHHCGEPIVEDVAAEPARYTHWSPGMSSEHVECRDDTWRAWLLRTAAPRKAPTAGRSTWEYAKALRDDVIRECRALGWTYPQIGASTGLSRKRLHDIIHDTKGTR